jgi:hypothetical protein
MLLNTLPQLFPSQAFTPFNQIKMNHVFAELALDVSFVKFAGTGDPEAKTFLMHILQTPCAFTGLDDSLIVIVVQANLALYLLGNYLSLGDLSLQPCVLGFSS